MEKEICGIYKIENKNTHQVYIGQSVDILRRWKAHKVQAKSYSSENSDNRLYHELHNHFEDFEFSIIEECDRSKLNEREVYWISYYDSTNPDHGYNISPGGSIGDYHRVLQQKQLNEIANLLVTTDLTQEEIADKFQTGRRTVSSVNTGYYKIDNVHDFPIRNRKFITGKVKERAEQKKARLNGRNEFMCGTCKICGGPCSTRANICHSCQDKERDSKRPSKEILYELVKTMSYSEIGRMFNVSGNAIKKWCKRYGINVVKDIRGNTISVHQ